MLHKTRSIFAVPMDHKATSYQIMGFTCEKKTCSTLAWINHVHNLDNAVFPSLMYDISVWCNNLLKVRVKMLWSDL